MFVHLVHPIVHKLKFTKERAYGCIAFAWLFSIGYNLAWEIPGTDIVDGNCLTFAIWPSDFVFRFVGLMTIFVEYFFPIMMMAFCYGRMFYVLQQKVAPVAAEDHGNGHQPTPGGSLLDLELDSVIYTYMQLQSKLDDLISFAM